MKTLVEFRFWTKDFNTIADAPKHLVTKANYLITTILVDRDAPEFTPLWEWARIHQKTTVLDPHPSYVYTKAELDSAEIFYLPFIHTAPAEIDSDYGTKYRTIKSCERPDKDIIIPPPAPDAPFWAVDSHRQAQIRQRAPFEIKEQISPLFTDTNKLSKTIDFQQLRSDEVLINKRLADILAEHHIQGYEVKPVFRPRRIHRWGDEVEVKDSTGVLSSNWFQLNVTAVAGPIAQPPTEFGPAFLLFEPSKTGTYQLKECDLISSPKIGTSLYFRRAEFPHTDIVRTKELIITGIPCPYILITQKLYRIFKENKVKGFEARPAYFVD